MVSAGKSSFSGGNAHFSAGCSEGLGIINGKRSLDDTSPVGVREDQPSGLTLLTMRKQRSNTLLRPLGRDPPDAWAGKEWLGVVSKGVILSHILLINLY